MSLREKVVAMFLGTAIGDALGLPNETKTRQQIHESGLVTTFKGINPGEHKWHPEGLLPGATSDDTQLTLAVARALIMSGGTFNMDAIALQHVLELNRDNHLWGPSTRNAVKRLKESVHWSQSGITDKPNSGQGNGVVMKASPLAVLQQSLKQEKSLAKLATTFSYMTHVNQVAAATCAGHINALSFCFLTFPSHQFRLRFIRAAEDAVWATHDGTVSEEMDDLFGGLEASPDDEQIDVWWGKDPFLVQNSLGLSYAYFLRDPTSIDALYNTVNAGGDTDSNGAIVGGLLGALNGTSIFPKHLVNGLLEKEVIIKVANELCDTLKIE